MRRPLFALPVLSFAALTGLVPVASAQPVPGPESTLVLTWFGDPSTSMVVQWLAEGELPPRAEGSSAGSAFEVPALGRELVFDGDASDWGDAGLRTDFFAMPNGAWADPEGTMAEARTAWTPEGLALLVPVSDADPMVLPSLETDWGPRIVGDKVEIRVTGAEPGGGVLKLQVARPEGADEELRAFVTDSPVGPNPPGVQAGVALTDAGYVVEALVPWSALPGVDGGVGDRLGLQVEVFDPVSGWWEPGALSWVGAPYPGMADRKMAPLVLVPAGHVDPVRARVEAHRAGTADGGAGPRVLAISGEPRLIGETVTVKSGELGLGEVTLENVQGWASAELTLGEDFAGAEPRGRLDAVSVELDGATIARELIEPTFWATAPEPAVLGEAESGQAPEAFPETEVLPFAGSGWFVQRARFEDLEPGTDYAVTVPGRLKPVRFRTAPGTLEEPIVFAEGGDVGTSSHVGKLNDEAAEWDPLFGLVGGDCAYGNGLDPEAWMDYLQLWNDHMAPEDGRSVPMVCAVGNHETVGNRNGGRPEDAPFLRALFGPLYSAQGSYGVLDFGVDAEPYASLYLLDSGHTADVHGTQQKWLERTLAERKEVLHQVVAYHVPAYPSVRDFDGEGSANIREHWVPLFEQQPIAMVFEHHDHAYKRTHPLIGDEPDPTGLLYFGDGCWGRTPRKVSPERPYLAVAKSERNVMQVTLNPDGSRHVLAVNEHGEVLDDVDLPATREAGVQVGALPADGR